MIVNEVYDIDIKIDETSLFSVYNVIFVSADLFESIMNPVPTCKLEVLVPVQWLDEQSIVDGTKLTFTITSERFNINDVYVYRLYNINKLSLTQNHASLILDGVLDFHYGYLEGNIFNQYNTTSNIMQNIADTYGITSSIAPTNDAQLWVAGENNVYQFMSAMTQRGWVDETSAMLWYLDRHKILVYQNLTSLFRERSEQLWTFIQTEAPDIEELQYNYTNVSAAIQSGTNNLHNGGYGGTDYRFELLDYAWNGISATSVTKESAIINISKELSQGLYKRWYPFDVGNFHANYELAYKQNQRVLSTYSTYLTAECQFFQPMRLGQIVDFKYTDSQNEDDTLLSLSGAYMIDAIHVAITLSSISADVELVMQGLNGVATTQETY